ncbi:MAG: aldehyde dehydrogenase family protein [Anaerolineales bacterium]|nr:aldehyde dehydrogenase family protein [Anaerolineales bacterium]
MDVVRVPNPIIISTNPATQTPIAEVPCATPDQIEAAMQKARTAQPAWAARPIEERANLLRDIQHQLYHHRQEVVDMVVKEQGKSAHEALLVEVLTSLEILGYFRKTAPKVLKPRRVFAHVLLHRRHVIQHEPHGVVLVISPWNFPVYLSIPPIAAALVAGNTVIFKPSEYATQTSALVSKLIHDAGIPADVFQTINGYGDVGAALIEAHPDKICFTGSERVGRKIATTAGEKLIPVTLELGGKDAALVMDDAQIDRAARDILWAGTVSAGQACASIERVYVMRSVADQLIDKMQHYMDAFIRTGPGTLSTTTYGAITTPFQFKIIQDQLDEAKQSGVQVFEGKHVAEGQFCAPTLVIDPADELKVMREETFGPVIAIQRVDSEAEAIARANNNAYGLTASIWTSNRERGLRIAKQLHVGSVSINDHIMSSQTPEMPWGGVKASGYGRTRGHEGLLEMTVTKSVSYERFPLPFNPLSYPYTSFKRAFLRRFINIRFGPSWRDKIKGQ